MKKIKYIIPLIIAVFLMSISCTDTFEVHEKYIEGGEIIYTSKVDSLETHPGNGRLKISGYLTNGFSVNEITVYWNKGESSQTFPYTKTANQDVDLVELIVDGLEEQSYQFDVYSKDEDGNKSIKITTFGTVYGELYRGNLEARAINSFAYGADNIASVNFKPSSDLTRSTEVKFINLNGEEILVSILNTETTISLEQLDLTKPIMYRTYFVPTAADENGNETSIDEFPSDWKTYVMPNTFDSIFESFTFESISGGVIVNWENIGNIEMTFDFMNVDKQDQEVVNTLTSSESVGTYTFTPMKVEEQDVEITISDIYGNSKSISYTVSPLPAAGKGNWSIIDFSTEEAGGEGPVNGYATAAIDGDTGTFWHSNWSSTGSSFPHHLTIDMGEEKNIAGFELFTRNGFNGGATEHEFWVSMDNVNYTKVATLNEGIDPNDGTLIPADAVTTARYVKYVATAGPNSFTYLGEINVIESMDNSDWSIVDFSTEEAGGEGPVNGYATAAIDGDTGTFWHSNWSSTGSSYPHHLTIDLGAEKGIAGFEIFTRKGFNGGATVHEFWVSSDNVNFTQVASLNAALDPNNGSLVYSDAITTARYVKYVAIEGPNNFTYLGEIKVLGAID